MWRKTADIFCTSKFGEDQTELDVKIRPVSRGSDRSAPRVLSSEKAHDVLE
jgi:hypothetical protein